MIDQGTLVGVLSKPNGLSPEIVDMGTCLINSLADNQEVEILKPRGHDFKAVPGDVLFVAPVGGTSANKVAVMTHAELTPDTAMLPGDSDIHANVAGIKVSQVKCGADGLITIKNAAQNLNAIMTELITILSNFNTIGSPGNHLPAPTIITQLSALQVKVNALLKAV